MLTVRLIFEDGSEKIMPARSVRRHYFGTGAHDSGLLLETNVEEYEHYGSAFDAFVMNDAGQTVAHYNIPAYDKGA